MGVNGRLSGVTFNIALSRYTADPLLCNDKTRPSDARQENAPSICTRRPEVSQYYAPKAPATI